MTEKRPLSFALFWLRLFSGLAAGVGGTLIAFVAYFLMVSFVPSEGSSSLSVFSTLVIALAATLSTNVLAALLVSFMDEEKYSRRKTMVSHVFVFNLILFLFTVPFYALAAPAQQAVGVMAIHFVISAFITSLILELLAGQQYSLLGLYSNALGIFCAIGLGFLLSAAKVGPLALIFGTLPMTWLMLQVMNGFGEWGYDVYLKYYGLDALNDRTDLGGDAETEEPEEEAEEEEKS